MRYPYFWDYPPHRRRVLTVTACTCLAGVMLGGVSHMYRNPAPAPAKTTVLAERANQTGLVLGKDSSEDESTAPSSDGSPPPDPAPAGELSANGDTGSPPPPAPSVGATGALPTALEQPPAPSQALTSTQGAGAVEAPANSSARALPGLSGSPLGNLGAQRGEDAVGNGLGAPLSAPAAPKVRAKPSQKDEDDREHRPSRKDRDSQRGKDGQKDSDQGKPRDRQDGDDLDVDAVPEPSSSAASATAGQPVGPVPAAPPAGTALTPLSVPAQVPTQPSLAPAAPTSGSPVAALGAPQPASSMPAVPGANLVQVACPPGVSVPGATCFQPQSSLGLPSPSAGIPSPAFPSAAAPQSVAAPSAASSAAASSSVSSSSSWPGAAPSVAAAPTPTAPTSAAASRATTDSALPVPTGTPINVNGTQCRLSEQVPFKPSGDAWRSLAEWAAGQAQHCLTQQAGAAGAGSSELPSGGSTFPENR